MASAPSEPRPIMGRVDRAGRLIAVFDIDSDQPAAFDARDAEGLGLILADTFGRLGR